MSNNNFKFNEPLGLALKNILCVSNFLPVFSLFIFYCVLGIKLNLFRSIVRN